MRRSRTRVRWRSPITPSSPRRIRSTVATSSPPGAGAVAGAPFDEQPAVARRNSRRVTPVLFMTLMLSHVTQLRLDVDDLNLQVPARRLVGDHVPLPVAEQRLAQRRGRRDDGDIRPAL